jgi:hypothetical protein
MGSARIVGITGQSVPTGERCSAVNWARPIYVFALEAAKAHHLTLKT